MKPTRPTQALRSFISPSGMLKEVMSMNTEVEEEGLTSRTWAEPFLAWRTEVEMGSLSIPEPQQ